MNCRTSIPVAGLQRLGMSQLAGKMALLVLISISIYLGKAQTPMTQPQHVRNIVLVHGAWLIGSGVGTGA